MVFSAKWSLVYLAVFFFFFFFFLHYKLRRGTVFNTRLDMHPANTDQPTHPQADRNLHFANMQSGRKCCATVHFTTYLSRLDWLQSPVTKYFSYNLFNNPLK